MLWTTRAVDVVVESMRSKPDLWKGGRNCSSRKEKAEAYVEMVSLLKREVPGIDVEAVKMKIKCLRTAFQGEYRKVVRRKNEGKVHVPQWKYYKALEFLNDGGRDLHSSSFVSNDFNMEEKDNLIIAAHQDAENDNGMSESRVIVNDLAYIVSTTGLNTDSELSTDVVRMESGLRTNVDTARRDSNVNDDFKLMRNNDENDSNIERQYFDVNNMTRNDVPLPISCSDRYPTSSTPSLSKHRSSDGVMIGNTYSVKLPIKDHKLTKRNDEPIHVSDTAVKYEDEWEVFGRDVANSIRALTNDRSKRQAKFAVQKALFDVTEKAFDSGLDGN